MNAYILTILLGLFAVTARAETRRIAVVVGNNAGAQERSPLRYAETDAGKLSQVLVELGGVDAADLFLLQGRGLGELHDAITLAQKKVADWHRGADTRVVLLFYFSGHSDGESLEIGRQQLSFAELRRLLGQTGAEVRVAMVDSCKSGALLAAKGGRLGPAYQIRMNDDLASTGEALLTSSAADELALESKEIRGSFFTHHLVSGLRGAADNSGDGNVTLAEAYQYAFDHTVSATSSTVIGTQHPAYGYHLSGQGELVLATLSRPSAALELPSGFDRVLVTQLTRDQVIAEIPAGAQTRLAVPPGEYGVRGFRGSTLYSVRVAVGSGETRSVAAKELVVASNTTTLQKKGDDLIAKKRYLPSLFAAIGVQGGVAKSAHALGTLRLGVGAPTPSGWSLAFDLSTGRGNNFWETSALLFAGYRLGLERGRFRGFLGLEAGGGLVSQKIDGGEVLQSGTFAGGPWVGIGVRVARHLSLTAEGHLPIGWIARDGGNALVLFPAGWLGVLANL